MEDPQEYAVRWAQRFMWGGIKVKYTKWHWTKDSDFTLCGHPVVILPDRCPVMPQTDGDPATVECSRCRLLLEKQTAS